MKLKAKHATILGVLQSTLTDFGFLRKQWKDNCEEERLLGVSITGTCDHPILQVDDLDARRWLKEIKGITHSTAAVWAEALGINCPVAITVVKPSGCTSPRTKVLTSEGVKSMADIFTENGIDNLESIEAGTWIKPTINTYVYDENNDKKLVTSLFVNGMSEVYEIEFEDGNSYRFTAEHKLKTTSGWKRCDKLTEDDEIVGF